MKKAILQYWEESGRNWGVRPDGCSLHVDAQTHKKFVDEIYSTRIGDEVPDEYDRIVDEAFEVEVSDAIYNEIMNQNGSLRLMQNSLTNLKNLEEIILCDHDLV